MAVNDSCRLCDTYLRVGGSLTNCKLIFDRKDVSNVASQLSKLGCIIDNTPLRSYRVCRKCCFTISRLLRDNEVLQKWKEKEIAVVVETCLKKESTASSSTDKRDREPTPSETPRAVKKSRTVPTRSCLTEDVSDTPDQDHDYCSFPVPAAVDLSLDQTEDLRKEVEQLRKRVEERSVRQRFCLGRYASSDDDIRFYTRFVTYNHLMAFWRLIEPASHNMVRVTRARAATNRSEGGASGNASGQCLQPIDEFFLFMVYLSLGLTQRDLADRFDVHQSNVSRIITTWANFLYTALGSVCIWMPEEAVKAYMPKEFQDYPDTRVLIDCTELRCQTPSSLPPQSEEFSCKSHCTFKGLIGMAPHGAVTFVSSLHAGSISDKELLKRSGIVSLLKPDMAIMVDKGFLVDDCVPCKVYRPADLSKRKPMSAGELKETRLRVHVERLMHRVKQHKLFDSVIPLSISGSINKLYTVACLLVNYQNGPLVKTWAKE